MLTSCVDDAPVLANGATGGLKCGTPGGVSSSTALLLDRRPMKFGHMPEQTLPDGDELPPEYGPIAEEVAEVFPDVVVYDEQGQPFAVKHHEEAPMLWNEMKKQKQTIEALRQEHEREVAALATRLARIESRVIDAPNKPQR